MNVVIRPASLTDVYRAQELRKLGWQDNYVYPEGGVTRALLQTKLAALPVIQADLTYYTETLRQPENAPYNLVAEMDGAVCGVVFYELQPDGSGDIGVFVDKAFRGRGIGSQLLQALIEKTTNPLQVTIFARNPSRTLYKKFGFVEEGPEARHYFSDNIYLPIQKLVLVRH